MYLHTASRSVHHIFPSHDYHDDGLNHGGKLSKDHMNVFDVPSRKQIFGFDTKPAFWSKIHESINGAMASTSTSKNTRSTFTCCEKAHMRENKVKAIKSSPMATNGAKHPQVPFQLTNINSPVTCYMGSTSRLKGHGNGIRSCVNQSINKLEGHGNGIRSCANQSTTRSPINDNRLQRATNSLSDSKCDMDQVDISILIKNHMPSSTSKESNCSLPYAHDLFLQDHSSDMLKKDGLGIVDFLKGKNIFITGATGFLAKVLVEKILRVQPDVQQLFLLIKAPDLQSAKIRLHKEILGAELFRSLQNQYGEAYEAFMNNKVTPILGNITMDNLGLDPWNIDILSQKLDLVVNLAATTTFDERYDYALEINTLGAMRVLEFSKKCQNLQLLMHVSTAFVNGRRKGVVLEKTFTQGHSISKEISQHNDNEKHDLDVKMEIQLARKWQDCLMGIDEDFLCKKNKKEIIQTMKDMGLQRAQMFGWQDTYVFTKAMGEMLINDMRGNVPLVIVRPSVVESSLKEPFPGWMEGNRMMDPIILMYGKGYLGGFLVDINGVLDVVPVDMVANAMLAAMAKHACKLGVQVYQVASSVVNPLTFGQLGRLSQEHFKEHPFVDSCGNKVIPRAWKVFEEVDAFTEFVSQSLSKEDTKKTSHGKPNMRSTLVLKAKEQAHYLAKIYKPYTFYMGRFDNSNVESLYEDLSPKEKELFKFDVRDIDWETYIKKIHIPGLRKHVLKGRGSKM